MEEISATYLLFRFPGGGRDPLQKWIPACAGKTKRMAELTIWPLARVVSHPRRRHFRITECGYWRHQWVPVRTGKATESGEERVEASDSKSARGEAVQDEVEMGLEEIGEVERVPLGEQQLPQHRHQCRRNDHLWVVSDRAGADLTALDAARQ